MRARLHRWRARTCVRARHRTCAELEGRKDQASPYDSQVRPPGDVDAGSREEASQQYASERATGTQPRPPQSPGDINVLHGTDTLQPVVIVASEGVRPFVQESATDVRTVVPAEIISESRRRSEDHASKRPLKETVYDVPFHEVIEESSEKPLDQGVPKRDVAFPSPNAATARMPGVDAIQPGDPYEEGWVADADNDRRARHWRNDAEVFKRSRYTPGFGVSTSNSGGGVVLGWGSSGGGGGSRGLGGSGGSSSGDGHYPHAAIVVYAFLIATMGIFWWNIYVLVSKPELIGRKIVRLLRHLDNHRQDWRRKRAVCMREPKRTRYRTLCIHREGCRGLTRRIVSPIAIPTGPSGEPPIESMPSTPSMFLTLPRTEVATAGHSTSLHRVSTLSSTPSSPDAHAPQAERSPPFRDLASTLLDPHSPLLRSDCSLSQPKMSTPCTPPPINLEGSAFDIPPSVRSDALSGEPSPTPLPPLQVPKLHKVLSDNVDIKFEREDPSQPPVRLKRKSCNSSSARPGTPPAPRFRRNVTWCGTYSAPVSSFEDYRPTTPTHDVWQDPMCHVVPGSLAMYSTSLQRDDRLCSEDLHALRPKSRDNAALDEEPVRRSASLHSTRDLADALGKIPSEGRRNTARRHSDRPGVRFSLEGNT